MLKNMSLWETLHTECIVFHLWPIDDNGYHMKQNISNFQSPHGLKFQDFFNIHVQDLGSLLTVIPQHRGEGHLLSVYKGLK